MSSHQDCRTTHGPFGMGRFFSSPPGPATSAGNVAGRGPVADDSDSDGSPAPAVWQGGTGKSYPVREIGLDDFVLSDTSLYILVSNNRAIWIGRACDLIEDAASRSRFRQALKLASSAYKISCPAHEYIRLNLVSDLLAGHLLAHPFAA